MRLDIFLYLTNRARSRSHAQNLIKTAKVKINGSVELKSAREVSDTDDIDVSYTDDYASLGGVKLKKAIDFFKIDVKDKICIDIGASNGGFTDVLLKEGAAKVYAVDVSDSALPYELQNDDRVVVKDKLNARYIEFEDIGIKADIITVDVSFISLKLIIPALLQFMTAGSLLIALIKPQFEAGRGNLSKKGLVLNKDLSRKIVEEITAFCKGLNLKQRGVIDAPKPFNDKNQEYISVFY